MHNKEYNSLPFDQRMGYLATVPFAALIFIGEIIIGFPLMVIGMTLMGIILAPFAALGWVLRKLGVDF